MSKALRREKKMAYAIKNFPEPFGGSFPEYDLDGNVNAGPKVPTLFTWLEPTGRRRFNPEPPNNVSVHDLRKLVFSDGRYVFA